jgi:hypothetical protein
LSSLERAGIAGLMEGQRVVDVIDGRKGPEAADSSTAQQEPPRRARPERPMYPPADRAAVRLI